MRRIDEIIIHCSATRADHHVTAMAIREWHKARGWDDIGYHFVIERDGELVEGRDLETVGAHAKGHNRHSIGVCMVGGIAEDGKPESNFSREQWRELDRLISGLRWAFPNAIIRGHRDLPGVTKACPSFDVLAW